MWHINEKNLWYRIILISFKWVLKPRKSFNLHSVQPNANCNSTPTTNRTNSTPTSRRKINFLGKNEILNKWIQYSSLFFFFSIIFLTKILIRNLFENILMYSNNYCWLIFKMNFGKRKKKDIYINYIIKELSSVVE